MINHQQRTFLQHDSRLSCALPSPARLPAHSQRPSLKLPRSVIRKHWGHMFYVMKAYFYVGLEALHWAGEGQWAHLSSHVSGNTSHFSPVNRMEAIILPYIVFIIWDMFLPCLVSPEFVITNGTGFLTEVIKCPFLQMTWLCIKDPGDSIRKPLELTNMWS